MKRFIPFPSIGQLNNATYNIKHHARFTGELNDEGKPVYDQTRELPIVSFTGTVKLHGSCGSVCYSDDGLWFQSRKSILIPGKTTDNHGFAFFCEERRFLLQSMMDIVVEENQIDITKNTICVFGEWCGGSIQKKVAINGLPKMFVIFSIGVVPHEYVQPEGESFEITNWLDIGMHIPSKPGRDIYNIDDFQTYHVNVDFENIHKSNNLLVKLTNDVEQNCPVAKQLNSQSDSTVGEGIVWTGEYKGKRYTFKCKGEDHAGSKVKVLDYVDEEFENLKRSFANEVCTSSRLNQAVQEVFDTLNGGVPLLPDTGKVIRWVMQDIIKEETLRMEELGLNLKQVGQPISLIVRRWFISELNNGNL
ncbi:MAG: hypothetical protein PF440_00430 [Thiomicrorhabdus sp.]|jgi:hypothetical protein|nr:hypothetical protein [Thiomicrorhabdus sp.]